MTHRAKALVGSLCLLCAACTQPAPPPAAKAAKAAAPAEPAEPAEPVEAAEPDKAGELPLADVKIPDPPSADELALLERDPSTYTPQERRIAAAARYKKVMQNPDSPEARVIRQARAAVEGGQLPGAASKGPTLHAPAPRPTNPPPATP